MSSRVLCAVDFSESARNAMHVAAHLARDRDATLELVHVQERPLWTNEPPVHFPGDVRQSALEAGARDLEIWRREAEKCVQGLNVVTRTTGGSPWDQIVAIANADPTIEVIVVGTHGRSGVARALIGSVAERVARHAPCSVLVVRPKRAH